MHEERKTRQKAPESRLEGPVPRYILDREEQTRAKVLSNTIKQKRKEKAVISWFHSNLNVMKNYVLKWNLTTYNVCIVYTASFYIKISLSSNMFGMQFFFCKMLIDRWMNEDIIIVPLCCSVQVFTKCIQLCLLC